MQKSQRLYSIRNAESILNRSLYYYSVNTLNDHFAKRCMPVIFKLTPGHRSKDFWIASLPLDRRRLSSNRCLEAGAAASKSMATVRDALCASEKVVDNGFTFNHHRSSIYLLLTIYI